MSRPIPILHPSLPCPFCAWPAYGCHAEEVSDDAWTVICEACGANGPLDTHARNTASQAVFMWDARPEILINPEAKAALAEQLHGSDVT